MALGASTATAQRAGGPISPGDETRTSPARQPVIVTVSGDPGSFQVISVPVPEGFPSDRVISYEIIQSDRVSLLGSRMGKIEPNPSQPRTILLTLQVPGFSRVGSWPIALVRFSVPTLASIDVPIQLAVTSVQRIELTAVEGLRAARPGDAFTLTFRVTNLGNSADTVDVQVIAPPGWRLPAGALLSGIALDVFASAHRTITIGVPPGSATGSVSVRLIALSRGRPVGSTEVPVQVVENVSASSGEGARLTTGFGVAAGPGSSTLGAFTTVLDGQLSDEIRVSARATIAPGGHGLGLYGLARAGLYPVPPSAYLTASRWRLGLGLVSARLSDLAGVGVAGQGTEFALSGRRWTASGFLARPQYGEDHQGGEFAGGRFDVRLAGATLSGVASHLAEDRLDPRQLDAVAFAASLPRLFQGAFSTEIAQRWFRGGAALGWTAEYERRVAANEMNLRIGYAPGGAAAFARATSEVSARVGRTFGGRLFLNGSYYRNGDDSRSGFASLATSGWSLGSLWQVTPVVGLGLEARRSAFDAVGGSGTLGNGETALSGSANLRRGRLYGTVAGSLSSVERRTSTPGGSDFRESAPRTSGRIAAGIGGAAGILEVTARVERGGAGLGYLARQGEVGVQADRIRVRGWGAVRMFANGRVQRMTWFGDRSALTAVTAGLTVEFPAGLGVGMSAERNPLILTSVGAGGWFYSIKIDRTTVLPRMSRPSTRGFVFQDLNGNGIRDLGEPGFAGVLVRAGSASGVAARDGGFHLDGTASDSAALDPESLPMGWIVGRRSGTARRLELAVVAVAAVEVTVELAPEVLERLGVGGLAGVTVMARDQGQRIWVARASAPGRAVFDALPPGHYAVELDLTEVAEPLSPAAQLPEFTVGSPSASPRLLVTLRSRPVKLKNLGSAGAGPGGGTTP
jgi:hypothetical protein